MFSFKLGHSTLDTSVPVRSLHRSLAMVATLSTNFRDDRIRVKMGDFSLFWGRIASWQWLMIDCQDEVRRASDWWLIFGTHYIVQVIDDRFTSGAARRTIAIVFVELWFLILASPLQRSYRPSKPSRLAALANDNAGNTETCIWSQALDESKPCWMRMLVFWRRFSRSRLIFFYS